MADGRAHAGLAATVDATDARPHAVVVALAQFLHGVELGVLAAVAREPVDGVLVADCLEGLAHQDEALLLDVDDALAAVDLAVGGRRHVHQERRGDVAVLLVALDVHAVGGREAGLAVHHVLHQAVQVEVVALALVAHLPHALGAHQLEVAADLGDHAAVLVEGGGHERGHLTGGPRLAQGAPRRPVVLDAVVPLVVHEDLLAKVLLGLVLALRHVRARALGGHAARGVDLVLALGVAGAAALLHVGVALALLGGGVLIHLALGHLLGLHHLVGRLHRLGLGVVALVALLLGVALHILGLDLVLGLALGLDQLLHDRRHEGRHLHGLVLIQRVEVHLAGVLLALGRLLGRPGLLLHGLVGERLGDAPAPGLHHLVDHRVDARRHARGVGNGGALLLHVHQQGDRALAGLAHVGGHVVERRVARHGRHHHGVDHLTHLGQVSGRGAHLLAALQRLRLDQVHVAADARVRAPDERLDALALDDVEDVARQRRRREHAVELGQVALATPLGLGGGRGERRLAGAHRAPIP